MVLIHQGSRGAGRAAGAPGCARPVYYASDVVQRDKTHSRCTSRIHTHILWCRFFFINTALRACLEKLREVIDLVLFRSVTPRSCGCISTGRKMHVLLSSKRVHEATRGSHQCNLATATHVFILSYSLQDPKPFHARVQHCTSSGMVHLNVTDPTLTPLHLEIRLWDLDKITLISHVSLVRSQQHTTHDSRKHPQASGTGTSAI